MSVRRIAHLTLIAAALCCGSVHAQSCVSDEDCQDGSWCNGIERCEGNPTRAICMPAQRPMCSMKQVCDEVSKRCLAIDKVRELTACPEGQAWSAAERKCVATRR